MYCLLSMSDDDPMIGPGGLFARVLAQQPSNGTDEGEAERARGAVVDAFGDFGDAAGASPSRTRHASTCSSGPLSPLG